MRLALHLALVALVLSAGCVADTPRASTTAAPSSSTATPTSTPELTTADVASSVACNDGLTISFWYLGHEDFWDSSTVRVGYYFPPNTSVLFVTYVDGDVAGSTYLEHPYDDGYNADGDTLDLDTEYDGNHTVQVVAYEDTNDSEAFEKGVDQPCRADGELVQAGPEIVDFSRF